MGGNYSTCCVTVITKASKMDISMLTDKYDAIWD